MIFAISHVQHQSYPFDTTLSDFPEIKFRKRNNYGTDRSRSPKRMKIVENDQNERTVLKSTHLKDDEEANPEDADAYNRACEEGRKYRNLRKDKSLRSTGNPISGDKQWRILKAACNSSVNEET